jgi:hypothetical protein
LKGTRVLALVGKLVAAGMAQHVRMDAEGHVRPLAKPRHHLAEPRWGDRSAALRHEHMRPWRIFPLQAPQRSKLGVREIVGCRVTALGSPDPDRLAGEVNLILFQAAKLTGPQPMPECDQDGRGVTVAPAGFLAGDRHQPFDFALGQVFATSGNCPVYRHGRRGVWHRKNPNFAG